MTHIRDLMSLAVVKELSFLDDLYDNVPGLGESFTSIMFSQNVFSVIR